MIAFAPFRCRAYLAMGIAFLAGCGGSQPPIGAPGAMPQSRTIAPNGDTMTYKMVYSLSGSPDGYQPEASVIDVGGTLYGTTQRGGRSCQHDADGCGTVFTVTPGGKEKVIYRFGKSGADGSHPFAGLINVGGTLYGTTISGGSAGLGTVFSITPSGNEKVVHNFVGGSDGAYPVASLIDVKGTLYGTTSGGGSDACYRSSYSRCGTVFSITPSGTEKVLHSFGNGTDGAYPAAQLIDVNAVFYGTTSQGGVNNAGTVFSITLSGTEKVVHSFAYSGSDGSNPVASLIGLKGTLYGTTPVGGASNCYQYGACGTVFSITPSGTEKVLHKFGTGTDGASPVASLVEVKGKLYGTTAYGGAYQYHCGSRCYGAGGTVFSITPSGTEKVLHSFANGTDGSFPGAILTQLGGTLYGTTEYGGGSGCESGVGCGTVFAITL